MAAITLILADDHPLYIEGLEMLLSSDKQFKVEAKCTSGAEVIAVLKNKNCDVLLLDLHMADMDGVEAVASIRKFKPEQKIIMLTHQKGSRYLDKLEKLGINGYVLKNVQRGELVEAINTVHAGGRYFTKGIEMISRDEDLQIKSSVILTEHSPGTMLTSRELEILVRVCGEMSSSEIAKELFISVGTVDTHRKNILMKLGISNTVGLVKYAIKHKLLND
jgi:two-component system, NarL family, response regulator NreC